MQHEFLSDGAELGGADEAAMGDAHGMERPFELFAPECQELHQDRELRRDVVVLPNVALQQRGMIRQAVKNFRGRQAEAFELPHEITRCNASRHSPISFVIPSENLRSANALTRERHCALKCLIKS